MPYRLILDGNNIIHRWTSCARIKDFEGKEELRSFTRPGERLLIKRLRIWFLRAKNAET
jgi:hypothetical protein